MVSISVVNIKGGVGKTTSVVNIAACLALYNHKRVIVVDTDAQTNASTYLMTNQSKTADAKTVIDVLRGGKVSECISTASFKSRGEEISIDLLQSNIDVDKEEIKDIGILRKAMVEVAEKYDYCLYDCPPHLSNLALTAMCASDYVLVPALPDSDSMSGYSQLIDAVNMIRTNTDNTSLEILGIFINAIAKNDALDKYITGSLKDGLKKTLFTQMLRRSTIAKQCRFFGEPICIKARSSDLSEDYRTLTNQIVSRIKNKRGE